MLGRSNVTCHMDWDFTNQKLNGTLEHIILNLNSIYFTTPTPKVELTVGTWYDGQIKWKQKRDIQTNETMHNQPFSCKEGNMESDC